RRAGGRRPARRVGVVPRQRRRHRRGDPRRGAGRRAAPGARQHRGGAGGRRGMVDETQPYPRRHIRPYGITKAIAEQHVVAASSDRLATVVVRPRFVWGRDDSTLLPRFVEGARRGQLAWFDGGRYRTSTTHVANAAAGLIA